MLQTFSSNMDVLPLIGIAILLWLNGMRCLFLSSQWRERKFFTWSLLSQSVLIFVLISICFFNFTIDDTFISLRFARNLSNGFGLVFSTDGSAPVEGYTNFLWVLLEAVIFLFNLPDSTVLVITKILGILFGIANIIIVYFLIYTLTQNTHISLLGSLIISIVPYLAFWAVGGLETSMYIFFMLIGMNFFILEQRNDQAHIRSCLFLTLMALSRPEGVVFTTTLLLWDILMGLFKWKINDKRRSVKKIFPGIMIFIFFYGMYFLWRYSFYGYLFPNTFYARSGSVGITQLSQRFNEMEPFLIYIIPFSILACLGYFTNHQENKFEKILLLVSLALLFSFSFASKREWMPGYRYELPVLPFVIIFSSIGIHKILVKQNKKTYLFQTTFPKIAIVLCLCILLLYPIVNLLNSRQYTNDLDRAHITLGKWLKEFAPNESSYASWDMGAVPYYSELPTIFDIHPEGILSTYTTHHGYDVDYFLDQSPSFIVLPPQTDFGSKNGINGFYSNVTFKNNYQLIFSFAMNKSYFLDVYKNQEVFISSKGLKEGKHLADLSFSEAMK